MILPETRFYFRTTYHFKELLIYFNIYIKYLKSFLTILYGVYVPSWSKVMGCDPIVVFTATTGSNPVTHPKIFSCNLMD